MFFCQLPLSAVEFSGGAVKNSKFREKLEEFVFLCLAMCISFYADWHMGASLFSEHVTKRGCSIFAATPFGLDER